MAKKKFKIYAVDTGFCRVDYVVENPEGERVFYCLQDEGEKFGGVKFYRSTRELEPAYEVMLKAGEKRVDNFELPEPKCELTKRVHAWITQEVS